MQVLVSRYWSGIFKYKLVTTNTYVNPVIAVFLGWIILGEVITPGTVLAIVLVIFSIAGIMRNNRTQKV
ncbi:EamA family transporter [bacterium]|nr:EamA family transporter [bacterium]